jgi:hypothetical protein
MIGQIMLILILSAGAAAGIAKGISMYRIHTIQEDIASTRLSLQHAFQAQRRYSGLNVELAIKGEFVPRSLIKGNSLKNPWDGDIILSANDSNGSFLIEMRDVPQGACAQLANFQSSEWISVRVNGGVIVSDDVASVINSCQANNTIIYEGR